MITITRAVQTCMACPSQWDAWDADGNYYYLRYRHGCGQVTQYQTPDWVSAPWTRTSENVYEGNEQFIRHIASFEYGDDLDGSITLDEFARHAGITLAPGLRYTGYGDHLADQLTGRGIDPGTAQDITQPWRDLPHGPSQ